MLVIFFGVMVGVGLYCRKHSTDVNGFVLGGRSVGPWLTAFAYGTSYFSAVIFIGYVLTLWYKFVIRSNTVGNSFLAVYAEDFMAGFQYKEDAERYYVLLKERLKKFNLELEESKSRIIEFLRRD